MEQRKKSLIAAAGLAALSAGYFTGAEAQAAPLTFTGGTYTQDFNSLATSGSTNSTGIPTGWAFVEVGSSANVNGLYTGATGSGTGGDVYAYGPSTGTTSDRAFGSLLINANVPSLGFAFTNSTGSTITSLTISYSGEQWRRNDSSARGDMLDFQYASNTLPSAAFTTDPSATSTKGAGGSTFITSGSYASSNGATSATGILDYVSGVTSGAVSGGTTAPISSTSVTGTVTGLNIASGATFYMKWADVNVSGNDDGLAIDTFSMSAGLQASSTVARLVDSSPAGSDLGNADVTGNPPASFVIDDVDTPDTTTSGYIDITGLNAAPVKVLLNVTDDTDIASLVAALNTVAGTYGFTASSSDPILAAYAYVADYDIALSFAARPGSDGNYFFEFDFSSVSGSPQIANIGVVPEPASFAALGIIGAPMLLRRRRVAK